MCKFFRQKLQVLIKDFFYTLLYIERLGVDYKNCGPRGALLQEAVNLLPLLSFL